MTPKQCIEARRLLGWSQVYLAQATGIYEGVVGRFERTGNVTNPKSGGNRLAAMRAALSKAGVEFTDGVEPGVKLRRME